MSARFRWPSDAGTDMEEHYSSGHFAFELNERLCLLFVLRAMFKAGGAGEQTHSWA